MKLVCSAYTGWTCAAEVTAWHFTGLCPFNLFVLFSELVSVLFFFSAAFPAILPSSSLSLSLVCSLYEDVIKRGPAVHCNSMQNNPNKLCIKMIWIFLIQVLLKLLCHITEGQGIELFSVLCLIALHCLLRA